MPAREGDPVAGPGVDPTGNPASEHPTAAPSAARATDALGAETPTDVTGVETPTDAPGPVSLTTHSEAETLALGAALSRHATAGSVILLHGDLGAGKTVLARGFATALGIAGPIQSPTFSLVAEYDGTSPDGTPLRLYHLDLYRLDPADLASFGFEDYAPSEDGVSLIEWPERAVGQLPAEYLLVRIEQVGEEQREITVEAVPGNGVHGRWVKGVPGLFRRGERGR